MKLISLLGNSQRLDGGAMFGNAPRALWQRWAVPDDENRIALACRCLLVETDDGRRILLETGIGAFFAPELRERFGVMEPSHVLLEALAQHGVAAADIDVVVLSHLHFDHAGGLLTAFDADQPLALCFDNAQFLVGAQAWARANAPHARDRASFIPALQALLVDSGRLVIVQGDNHPLLPDGWRLHHSDGHTPGLMLVELPTDDGPMVFAADLIPGAAWVHAPVTMGYDRFPELLIDEKTALLSDLAGRGGWLFFTHDTSIAAGKVSVDARGRFGLSETVAALPR